MLYFQSMSAWLLSLQLLGRRREIEIRRAGYNTEIPCPLDNIPSSADSERARIEETVCSFFFFFSNLSSILSADNPTQDLAMSNMIYLKPALL